MTGGLRLVVAGDWGVYGSNQTYTRTISRTVKLSVASSQEEPAKLKTTRHLIGKPEMTFLTPWGSCPSHGAPVGEQGYYRRPNLGTERS